MSDHHPDETTDAARPRVGWFRFYFDQDRWEWSDVVQQMHGYQPGAMPAPTVQQVLSHKHPDDYPQVAELFEDIKRRRVALSSRHRIIDTNGRVHHVVVVGDELRDEDGLVVGTHGFYIDANPAAQQEQDRISAAVTEISENRAVIDQAKGMLMLLYGIDEAAAFELLRWRSQNANTKLRTLAMQLVSEFRALVDDGVLAVRPVYDNALLTVHQRIGSE